MALVLSVKLRKNVIHTDVSEMEQRSLQSVCRMRGRAQKLLLAACMYILRVKCTDTLSSNYASIMSMVSLITSGQRNTGYRGVI